MSQCKNCGSQEKLTSGIRTTDPNQRISLCGKCRATIGAAIDDMIGAGQRGPFVLNTTGTQARQGA